MILITIFTLLTLLLLCFLAFNLYQEAEFFRRAVEKVFPSLKEKRKQEKDKRLKEITESKEYKLEEEVVLVLDKSIENKNFDLFIKAMSIFEGKFNISNGTLYCNDLRYPLDIWWKKNKEIVRKLFYKPKPTFSQEVESLKQEAGI